VNVVLMKTFVEFIEDLVAYAVQRGLVKGLTAKVFPDLSEIPVVQELRAELAQVVGRALPQPAGQGPQPARLEGRKAEATSEAAAPARLPQAGAGDSGQASTVKASTVQQQPVKRGGQKPKEG
jgi:hypothetical protein